MEEKYYWGIVIDLMVTSKGLQELAQSHPTYNLDGSRCNYITHLYNVASLEIDYLEEYLEYQGISL